MSPPRPELRLDGHEPSPTGDFPRAWRWLLGAGGIASLLLITVGSFLRGPAPGLTGLHALLSAGLVLVVAGWLWFLKCSRQDRDDFLGGAVRGRGHSVTHRVLALVLVSAGALMLAIAAPHGMGIVASYLFVAGAALRLSWVWAVVTVAPALAITTCLGVLLGGHATTGLPGYVLGALVLLLLGLLVRALHLARVQAEYLAVSAVRSRTAIAERTRLEERARLARELHDIMAHALSGLIVTLEGARVRMTADDPDLRQVRLDLDRVRRLAHSGLEDTRQAVRALRGELVFGDDALEEMFNRDRMSGLTSCELDRTGQRRHLTPEAALVLYRTAQEALSNVRKHAPDSTMVAAGLHTDDNGVTLTLRNRVGIHHPPVSAEAADTGYGLVGLRERAELLAGTLDAGPDGDDGFSVRLWLPASVAFSDADPGEEHQR